jgi:hypothetical protein
MVCEEKVEPAGKSSWLEPEPEAQDEPISVWWDQPPVGEDDDAYTRIRAGIGRLTTRKPRT